MALIAITAYVMQKVFSFINSHSLRRPTIQSGCFPILFSLTHFFLNFSTFAFFRS